MYKKIAGRIPHRAPLEDVRDAAVLHVNFIAARPLLEELGDAAVVFRKMLFSACAASLQEKINV